MKYKSIEFFGISGVGKSYSENKFKSILKKNSIKVLNRREIVALYAKEYIKLNILEIITIYYYRFIAVIKLGAKEKVNYNIDQKNTITKFKKTNFKFTALLREKYILICKKLFHKYCKKNNKIIKIISELLNNLTPMEKKLFSFWIYEMFAAQYIFEKNSKNKNYIFLSDEGFISRAFLIVYSTIKNKEAFLNKYIKYMPKPDYCIYLITKKEISKKIQRRRERNKIEMWIEENKIKKFQDFEKKIFKRIKFKINYTKVYNDYNIINKLYKLVQ